MARTPTDAARLYAVWHCSVVSAAASCANADSMPQSAPEPAPAPKTAGIEPHQYDDRSQAWALAPKEPIHTVGVPADIDTDEYDALLEAFGFSK